MDGRRRCLVPSQGGEFGRGQVHLWLHVVQASVGGEHQLHVVDVGGVGDVHQRGRSQVRVLERQDVLGARAGVPPGACRPPRIRALAAAPLQDRQRGPDYEVGVVGSRQAGGVLNHRPHQGIGERGEQPLDDLGLAGRDRKPGERGVVRSGAGISRGHRPDRGRSLLPQHVVDVSQAGGAVPGQLGAAPFHCVREPIELVEDDQVGPIRCPVWIDLGPHLPVQGLINGLVRGGVVEHGAMLHGEDPHLASAGQHFLRRAQAGGAGCRRRATRRRHRNARAAFSRRGDAFGARWRRHSRETPHNCQTERQPNQLRARNPLPHPIPLRWSHRSRDPSRSGGHVTRMRNITGFLACLHVRLIPPSEDDFATYIVGRFAKTSPTRRKEGHQIWCPSVLMRNRLRLVRGP